jgi:exopolyphosphatase/guanosine-5'-triphosphate,3'-diphosphate pyrophosphatase
VASSANARLVAAVDLGSNSFHLVLASYDGGALRVIDRLKERVFLADGLDSKNRLSEDAMERAMQCLRQFRQRLEGIPAHDVRTAATNTFRVTREPADLLARAEAELGHRIELLSGEEEARLIYAGLRYDVGREQQRLWNIDIGGGSTEVAAGTGAEPEIAESLRMGSSSWSRRYFPKGRIKSKAMSKAILAARHKLAPIVPSLLDVPPALVTGSSGTVLSMARILAQTELTDGDVHLKALHTLRDDILRFDHLDDFKLPGLKAGRRPTFLGGLAILIGVMEGLALPRLSTSDGALREGILLDLLGRRGLKNRRASTVAALGGRYSVDPKHAARVAETSCELFDAVQGQWGLDPKQHRPLLDWAARLHEIGLAVRHTGFHRHGAYLLQNSNLAGFSNSEAELLARLVRRHRQSFELHHLDDLRAADREPIARLILLLRFATRLHRGRTDDMPCPMVSDVDQNGLELRFPDGWLEEHPMTGVDLENEERVWEGCGLELRYS